MTIQDALPGTMPKRIQAIHDAAQILAEVRDRKAMLKDEEEAASDRLIALMHKHELLIYRFSGLHVELKEKETVRIERHATAGEE